MHYINPFELLEINEENLSDVDSSTITKAKRKLLAEIELSDTSAIQHNGIELSKADCIRAIDDLDHKDKKEFHFFIFQHKHLNNFLTNGSLSFFENYQIESIYKLSEFLDFISPFFSAAYDKVLTENLKNGNIQNIKLILSVKPIVNNNYYEKSFIKTYSYLTDIDKTLKEIHNDFEVLKKNYIDSSSTFAPIITNLTDAVIKKINFNAINSLSSYFQGIKNNIAETLREIAVRLHNDPYEQYNLAFKVIDVANKINTEGLVKQTIAKDFIILKRHYQEDLDSEQQAEQVKQYASTFTKYREAIKRVEKVIEEVDAGNSDYISKKFVGLPEWVSSNINVSELNSLPTVFNDIRKRIAIQAKHLSVSIWNDYENIEPSFKLIQIASSIEVDDDTKAKIKTDYETLKDIDERRKKHGKPIDSTPSMYTFNGIGTKIYDDTLYFVFVFIPIIPIARYSLQYDGHSSYRFFGKLKLHFWQRAWLYAILGGILYLIISSIIESKQIQSRNESFKIMQNGFTNTFSTDNDFNTFVYSPYLIRKTLPINMRMNDVDEIYEDLPENIKATSPSEVKSLIQLWRGAKVVGEYTDHTNALQNYCFFKIIDLETKTEVYEDTIFGSLPPNSKSGNYSASGTPADYNLKDFISKLPSSRTK